MKYLLDTNVISEVSKHDKADANVVAWYNSVERDSVCLSVLVIGEIRAGIEKLRVDRPKRASDFERRLILTIDLFADRIISIDHRVAERWGRLMRRGNGRPSMRCWLRPLGSMVWSW
ncbi:MAG: VapC toxin family domain ribonuclease [Solirubrobacterales bacterium]|nr:VapC toxin family domain ribonuclease [Solirubrobacterales bacterium]